MSNFLKPFAWFFFALSAIGLALSLISHVAAILGLERPLGDHAFVLHIGIFVVWVPAISASSSLSSNLPRKAFWKATSGVVQPGWDTWLPASSFTRY
jgi:hypothetical protein